MSEIKAGDKIYFQGNQGKVMRVVTQVENEPLLEVVLTQKRLTYLKPSQLDLYPVTEKLDENQQIVLEWLKNIYNSPIIINPIAVVFALHNELVKDSEIDAVEAYEELGFDEEIQVLQVFSQWAQEQEEV